MQPGLAKGSTPQIHGGDSTTATATVEVAGKKVVKPIVRLVPVR